MNTSRKMWIVIGIVGVCAGMVRGEEKEKEGVALTVYNGGYGVVREIRELDIGADGMVKFKDVASAIDATTVHFKSLTDPAAKLMEQNYQYDLVSADKLLKKYLDREITVVCKGKGYTGKLLSFDPAQIVLQEAGGGVTMVQRADNVQDIRFSALPGGLLTQPTLLWLVATEKPGKHLSEVTYQTGGLMWHAEYVLVLNGDDTAGDLSGWVSVNNSSGKTYREAKMKFIAGDVRKILDAVTGRGESRRELAKSLSTPRPMEEKAFFEYHMYTLPRPSTVADNETKQLEMFTPATGVKVEKRFLYNPLGNFRWNYGGQYTDRSYGVTSEKKVNVFVEFTNSEANKLGIPLPAGKVRVYKQDPADRAMEFIGEEQIDHTPKDEQLSLQIGNAFDIVGERKQTEFKVESGRNWMSETIEIKVRNHKKEAVTVRCKEPLYRWVNWNVTAKSEEFTKLDARTIVFDVKIEPDKEKTVTYTVEYTW
ncbi:MAG: DUF4139 domain-containing protein [Planctomycetota bacterium]|nr:DUF4139 domain-containing protein [Planctomycetota bacterium]